MRLNRRDTSKLLLAGALVPLVPGGSMAAGREDWVRRLQSDLDAHLISGCDGTLRLVGFGMGQRGGGVAMAAVIQLDWPPGFRRRRFDAQGDQAGAAYEQLLNEALLSFARAWPGCVV